MNALVQNAADHWVYVAPLLSPPQSHEQYEVLVSALDELQNITGYDQNHPLDGLVMALANLISDYDQKHFPIRNASAGDVLRSLMEEYKVSQRELPELGSQSTVSQLLAGKRKFSVRQIKAAAARFGVSPQVFMG